MIKKNFTPQEANQRLPLVKKIVEDILAGGRRLKALGLMQQTPSVEKDVRLTLAELENLMGELEEMGCYFKDWNFEIGLVDFPSVIEGKQVLLCWRSDESSVQWCHSWEDGYPGRKPIP